MSKPGVNGAGSGPTSKAAAQKQKALLQRVVIDVGNIIDNFSLLVNVARNYQAVRNSQEAFQMVMRAARIVQSAALLLKLVSELKQTALFSGFASLNENVEHRVEEFNQQAERTSKLLEKIGEQAAASLKELETQYYSSIPRTRDHEW